MKKLLTLLAFLPLVVHGATITESNLTAVTTLGDLDNVRVNLKTLGLSRMITKSNLAHSLTASTLGSNQMIKAAAATNLSYSVTNFHDLVRDFCTSLMWTHRQIDTNGAWMPMSMGDSLMSANFLYADLFQELTNIFGYAGAIGQGGGSALNPLPIGGAYSTNDLTVSWGTFYVLPGSGTVVYTNALNSSGINGNVIQLNYQAVSGAGAIAIDTNLNGGTWATMVASNNCNNGGASTTLTLRYTNAIGAADKIMFRVRSTNSGTVKLLGGGIYNLSHKGGAIFNDFALNGGDYGGLASVPTNNLYPLLKAWNPQLVVWEATDTTLILSNNFGAINYIITKVLTNSDHVVSAINPIETSDDLILRQNEMWFTNCVALALAGYPVSYFQGYKIFAGFSQGLQAGMLQTNNNVHPSADGEIYEAKRLVEFLGIRGVAERHPNNPRRFWPGGDFTTTGNLDITGNFILRAEPFTSSAGILGFIHGNSGTNLAIYPRGLGFGFRDVANSTELWQMVNASGTIKFLPGGVVGVPYNIGGSGVNEAPLNVFASNVTAYAGLTLSRLSTNQAVLIGDANGVASWKLPYTLQEVRSVSNALQTVASPAIFAVDDTTLGLAEATNVLAVTITPQRADTFIIVEALLSYGTSANQKQAAGIFRDANATATSVGVGNTSGATISQMKLYTKFPSTSTSATTFTVRVGIDTGSVYINGLAAARLFGGTMESWIIAREVSQ